MGFLLISDNKWFLLGKFDIFLLKDSLKFGIPLVPAALAMFLVTFSDRYMLKWLILDSHSSLEQVGLYSLTYKLVQVMTLITAGFSMFWSPYLYNTYLNKDARQKYAFIFRCYAGVLSIFAILICAILPWIVELIFPAYVASIIIAPIMLAGFIIYNVGDYFCVGVDLLKRTDIRAFSGIIVALCNIALNLFLIPRLGTIGAALATTLSYGIYTSILLFYSQRFYVVNYAWINWIYPIAYLLLSVPLIALGLEHIWIYYFLGILIYILIFIRSGGFSIKDLTTEKNN